MQSFCLFLLVPKGSFIFMALEFPLCFLPQWPPGERELGVHFLAWLSTPGFKERRIEDVAWSLLLRQIRAWGTSPFWDQGICIWLKYASTKLSSRKFTSTSTLPTGHESTCYPQILTRTRYHYSLFLLCQSDSQKIFF